MSSYKDWYGQCFNIPGPKITGKNTPDQSGKVHIVTGGYAGCGYELARLLYKANATIYILGRSETKAQKAITEITREFTTSTGKIEYIEVDLSDLKTIKPAVEVFKSKEEKLHVLTNNAGVMVPPKGSVDKQGLDLQIGTNCVGPFLLTKLLLPILEETAKESESGAVRVTWAGSLAVDVGSYKPGGLCLDESGKPVDRGVQTNYGQSKAGNLYLASEFSRRYATSGVTHLCFNPGNLRSDLSRHMPGWQISILSAAMLFPTIYGGYTELWAAVSPEITTANSGSFIIPWGRFGRFRDDIGRALKPVSEGGNGKAQKFWEWVESFTEPWYSGSGPAPVVQSSAASQVASEHKSEAVSEAKTGSDVGPTD